MSELPKWKKSALKTIEKREKWINSLPERERKAAKKDLCDALGEILSRAHGLKKR